MIIKLKKQSKKYSVIYADPPWTYKDKCTAGERGTFYKYKTMTEEEIKNLKVKSISANDCVLFMWVTWPMLFNAEKIIKAWGFTYKTIGFVWVKQNKKADTLFMGMGNWSRSNSEICLLCTKGKPKRINASVHSIVMSHLEEHSKKPARVRDNIVHLCGDVPRIELFARETITGWDVWGNEVENTKGVIL